MLHRLKPTLIILHLPFIPQLHPSFHLALLCFSLPKNGSFIQAIAANRGGNDGLLLALSSANLNHWQKMIRARLSASKTMAAR